MNRLENITNQRTNQIKRQLIASPTAYIETIGKTDAASLPTLVDRPDGQSTIMRMIMGATDLMPYRAISYACSALHTADILQPDQLQIIHANHLGNKINGKNLQETTHQARLLGEHVAALLTHFPRLEGRVLHAFDTPLDTDKYAGIARQALEEDQSLAGKLALKGKSHSGDSIRYVAAHFAFQDTGELELEALTNNAPAQLDSKNIISIGCGMEKAFYKARMGMRGLLECVDTQTSQIFTHHLASPYFVSHLGEPVIKDGCDEGMLERLATSNKPVHRDIHHFQTIMKSKGN